MWLLCCPRAIENWHLLPLRTAIFGRETGHKQRDFNTEHLYVGRGEIQLEKIYWGKNPTKDGGKQQ